MTNFLNDTENVLIQKRISDLVQNQLPAFLVDEADQFVDFMKTYYKWMELHELTLYDITQFEYKFFIEDGNDFITENGDKFILESERTDQSAFIKDEQIIGLESGATANVDRNTYIANKKLYLKNLTKTDFIENELVEGQTSRVRANVKTFFKNPMFASRSLLKNLDINTSTTTFLDLFFNQFLINFDLGVKTDKRNLIKHIIEVYRSKGSSISFDFLFKTLYDEQNLVFYSPKEDIFNLSSGDWVSNKILRIQTTDPITVFEGRQITGIKSLTTAIVDRIERFALGNLTITELYLIDIRGRFVIGEIIRTNVVDDTFGEGKALGVLTNINIINPGTNYNVGDLLTITGGGGLEATARIKEVATGVLTDFGIIDGGDGYSLDSELTVNNFGTRGSGFAGRISEIQNAYTYNFNSDIIFDFAGVLLSADKYGMSGDPEANHYDRLVDALGFKKVNSGPITSIKTLVIGTNYQSLPKITATDKVVLKLAEDSGVKILNLNSDPDSSVFTPAITGFFDPGERIYSTTENGSKIGTFLGLVYNDDSLQDASRMRVKNSQYLGVYGLGANDLNVDNSEYYNQDYPTIYDVKVSLGGKDAANQIKIRRGLRANNPLINSATDYTEIEYIDQPIEMTADWQVLFFPIESITKSGTEATVTTAYKHGLNTGLTVNITGANDGSYLGLKEIEVVSVYQFKFEVPDYATTPVTGDLFYDEGIKVKFTIPYNHDLNDRYLFSAVDFNSNEEIFGYSSGATATVNTGAAFSPTLNKGENAIIKGVAKLSDAGSIGEIEITNVGAGYSTAPTISMTTLGDGNARLTANIGTIANTSGKYDDENGFLSYGKKIFDGYYYQNYSYVLKSKIQLNEYEQVVKKLMHPIGTKMFGEYIVPTDDLIFSFDNFLSFEDGSPIYLENQYVNRIIAEKYFEPNHDIDFYIRKDIVKDGSGTLVKIQGGNNIVISTSTNPNLNQDFVANSNVIIDNEQKFTASYGELKLEHNFKGKIISDSQNTLSRLILNNPVTYKKENLFILENYDQLVLEDGYSLLGLENYEYSEGTFRPFQIDEPIYQRKSDGQLSKSVVLNQGVNQDNNLVLVTHSFTEDQYDLNTNVFTDLITGEIISATSNLMFTYSYDYPLPKVIDLSYTRTSITFETEVNHKMKDYDTLIVKNSPIYTTTSGESFRYYDGLYSVKVLTDKKIQINTNFFITTDIAPNFYSANLSNRQSGDFQNDFKVGDIITFQNNNYETEILSIINATCVSTSTRIDSDIIDSFNILTENYYGNQPLILEDDNNTVYYTLESRYPNETIYDKKDLDYYMIMEQTVRGHTSANGLSDGYATLKGIDSKFHFDLSVNDIISLSSKPNLKSKILQINDFDVIKLENGFNLMLENDEEFDRFLSETTTIEYQELVLDRPLGDGTKNQTFKLFSTKNLDLEDMKNTLYLNNPYDGSNNYVYVKSSLTDILDEGLLLLEDGIGTGNILYNGTSSNEGKMLYESNTAFNDVKLIKEIKYY